MSSTHKYWVTRIISAANSYSFFCILIVFRQTVTAGSVQETVDCASRVRNACYFALVTVFVLIISRSGCPYCITLLIDIISDEILFCIIDFLYSIGAIKCYCTRSMSCLTKMSGKESQTMMLMCITEVLREEDSLDLMIFG